MQWTLSGGEHCTSMIGPCKGQARYIKQWRVSVDHVSWHFNVPWAPGRKPLQHYCKFPVQDFEVSQSSKTNCRRFTDESPHPDDAEAVPTLRHSAWPSLGREVNGHSHWMFCSLHAIRKLSLPVIRVINIHRKASQLPALGRQVNGHSHRMFCSLHTRGHQY